MYSFLILSFLVTPIANLNIFISATSISSTCFCVTATVSTPYTIAGLTTELYTFPFTLAGNLLSQITPDNFLFPFHPACNLFFTFLSQLPLSCTVDPKYLNSFTLGNFVSSIFTVFCYFLHLCTDIRSLTYLLSSLFFPMRTSRILVSAPLLPWSLCKSQYHQQTALSTMVLSLLHPLACPLSLQTGTDLTLIPDAVQPFSRNFLLFLLPGLQSRSRSRNILSDSDSSCPIFLHISDVNRATYAAARGSGVQFSNLFKRTLPCIA